MKLTINNVLALVEGMKSTDIIKKALPAKTAYKLMKLTRLLNAEYKDYDEARQALVNKYGSKKDDGTLDIIEETGTVKITDVEGFNKEFIELIETEVELDYTPISIDDLGDIELSAIDLMNLEKLLQ